MEKNALSIFYSFLFTSFLQNDEDMLIPPGPNTKTKDDILPSPEILELIDMHVSEVNICDFKDKSYRISLQPRQYILSYLYIIIEENHSYFLLPKNH